MPPLPPSRTRTLKQHLRAAATERLGVKLAALFFSLVLWLIVSAEEPTEEWVDVHVALVLDSTVTLRSNVPRVQALVVGRGRELLKLYTTTPIIRRVIGPDTPESLMLDLRPGDVDLPAGVDVRVRDLRPRSIGLTFSVVAERSVPVKPEVSLRADSGVRITGSPRVDPDSVRVRGPRAAVQTVDSIVTTREGIIVREPTSVVVPLDTAGLRVKVTPAKVRVRIPAESARTTDSSGGALLTPSESTTVPRRDTTRRRPPE